MVERRVPIPVTEAVQRVMAHEKQLEAEYVSIEESDGRLLAEPIRADHDVPPFDRSPYDGFAIKSEDTKGRTRENPVKLQVVDHIGAGYVASKPLEHGQAIRIMTGAQLPVGADAIIMLELVEELEEDGQACILIKREVPKGDNISYKGEDTKEGTVLVEKGVRITPGIKAVLATFGYSKVEVAKQPRVGVIATGSELLELDEPLEPGKIRNSNAFMVMSQVKKAGGIPVNLGKFADDLEVSYNAVKNALSTVDVLITTGGVSVGDFDFLPEIYKRLGAKVLFNKIAMRPGSVTTVALLEDKLLFGLSGNPSACFVGFELYAAPYVRSLQGETKRYLSMTKAVLGSDFPKPNPFARFIRSHVDFRDGSLLVNPVGLDKSNVVTSLAGTNALTVLPGGSRGYSKGDRVDVLMLNGEGSDCFDLEHLSNRRLQK
ncbi:molybdopterin molybdotransferase MoeA [Pullulanibacillus sp. KACC 23026]|uniref:molybdopterin molybdotransferase MoeA n=1 Tax=Pullulanibacillus sp. KACC 23026 TaxID=3028315 RepID=UPI0023B087D0|nr:gephyrin-like molybdotransferase Glp [Pullulanibacillus sp. KACC 23026]WEG11938.1 molybdopterin molybdotransferase MoeA [Pullulanibacillus sp. KACC 23026]